MKKTSVDAIVMAILEFRRAASMFETVGYRSHYVYTACMDSAASLRKVLQDEGYEGEIPQ